MTVSQGLAVLVFVVVFILIAIEAIHRTYASMIGALIFVILGAVKPEDIIARAHHATDVSPYIRWFQSNEDAARRGAQVDLSRLTYSHDCVSLERSCLSMSH